MCDRTLSRKIVFVTFVRQGIDFKIIKKSKKSWARLGLLKTSHGAIETPSLVPVATQAVVKTLNSAEVLKTKAQILICNTYHLHLKPGESVIESAGGLHKFMNWSGPLMTDSGGFQVFSLGFGHDLQVGKIIKMFPGKKRTLVEQGAQPQKVKITQDGVFFRSPIDGHELFLGPKESMRIQEALGADIIFAFDECTPPLSSRFYVQKSLERTHEWAQICLQALRTKQALFGIVQGSKFRDLRIKSARFINSLGFSGFGIGGDLGQNKETMDKILTWIIPELEDRKPRHMLGIGYLEDMERIIKKGIDLFDCTVPTHYARRGIAFTGRGKLDLAKTLYLDDQKSLDPKCRCQVCLNYSRAYLSHLVRANEITGLSLLTFHNLHYFNSYVEAIREKIKNGKL